MEELIVKLFYNLETEKKLGMKNQFNVHFSDKTFFFFFKPSFVDLNEKFILFHTNS